MLTRLSSLIAVLCLCSIVAFSQDEVKAHLIAGDKLMQEKKYDLAYQSYAKANKAGNEKCSVCLAKMAAAKISLQDEASAAKLANRAIAAASNAEERVSAQSSLGQVMLNFAGADRKKLAAGEAAFRKGLQEAPENAALHVLLGVALMRQEKDDEGKKELQAAIALAPTASSVPTSKSGLRILAGFGCLLLLTSL